MDQVFYWLFNMSIVAMLTGIVVMLVRIIKKIPRRIVVILWMIPLLRFWFPFGAGSKFGLMTLLSRFMTKTVIVYEGKFADFSMVNSVRAANSYFPITYKVNLLSDVFKCGAIVWGVVAAAIIIFVIAVYFSTVSELKDAEHLCGNVYCSNKVNSPAVYGIFHPRIVIPDHMKDAKGLELIVLHEKRHIRRCDNFWRILAFITAAIHWFNPLVWLFLKTFLSDVELACDESVLSELPEEKRKEYALELLNVQTSKAVFAAAFGGAKIKTRIEHIISYKKMTVFSVVGFGVLVAAIAYILLTNAA